ncbi:dihydrolipoamide acetyltransferase family protein [Agromyces atrinae]|uniref:Dihydrolipoamide acetyltransferase component of pyruvate dehydrogenase complex n=1 Tax=Agromyces atrinae TaxID=592376 RepID=A0A4Q2M2Z4_9MICO|nr:dihydrolipoamide acetyltransferase family protein [Agromyces atrinae]NYD65828.1 pyruvate dehydrogenase E2 component (dihydrolipoamide acetyltransferase) [Agromyces atrinae]RXZ86179.1 2-oxo acid dehydrogenase subunit E2 [Agromyces atrinae]
MSHIEEFVLPDLGEGLTESEVVAWRVAVGDRVTLNQIIADVETAKAVVELPSPFAGLVTALHAAEGETVDVGATLLSVDTDNAGDATTAPEPAPEPVTEERGPTLVGYGAAEDVVGPRRRARRATVADADADADAATLAGEPPRPSASEPPAASSTGSTPRTERPRSTPPVRRLARELGVDLESIEGTGERGLITRSDVEAAARPAIETSDSSGSETPTGDGQRRIPVRGVRRATAAAMVQSAFTAPHVTEFLTVDVTETMRLIDTLAASDVKISPLAVVAKAVCIAVRRTPAVNARWDEESGEIIEFDYVTLGIAAATERGLLVPNIPRADTMTLGELAEAIRDLAVTARSGKTSPARLTGGTISITNIGVFGIDAGTPILNPGEAAILAVGAVQRRPWEHQDAVALRSVCTLSLSFDHRVVDGAEGSRFLADVGALLREPGLALTMM